MSIFTKIASLAITLSLFGLSNSLAQTPGGVNTNANIPFWFDGSSFLNSSNGASIQTWNGRGGNSTPLVQSTAASRPQLRNNSTDRINGIPVIRFDGSDDHLWLADNADINVGTHTERTIHVVFRTGNDINSTQTVYEEGGATRGISMYLYNGSFYSALWNDNNDGPASPWGTVYESFSISPNTVYIASLVYDGGTATNNGTAILYKNGINEGTITGVGTLYEHLDDIAIGSVKGSSRTHLSNSVSTGGYLEGDVAEFIIANYAQNDNDLELSVDALAAKYDITPAVDLYTGDNPSNGDHDYEVFGIRQDGSGNANASANSGSILSSSSPSNLGNNEFLSIGNDNGAIASWTSTETHDPAYVRIAREWYVTESAGNVGTVTITIDATHLPSTGHAIGLLTDADGDFSSGATLHLATSNGSNYNVTLDLSDGDHLTVCGIPGEVSVTSSTQTVAEDVGTGNVTFQYNQTAQTDVTVNFTVSNGSATSGSDYFMSNGSAVIQAGSTTGTASFSVTLDCEAEGTEDFTVTITSTTSGSIGSPATQTVSITNVNTASSGPIGTACGLQHWYRPDAGISTISGRVNQWTDQQNSIPADANSSNNRPTLNSNSNDNTFNFQPYLEFDASNDYLGLDAFKQTNAIDVVYGFVVFRTDFSGGADLFSNWSFLDYDRSEYFNFYLRGDNGRIGWSFYENGTGTIKDNQGAAVLNDDRPHIGTFIYDNTLTNETRIFADGALDFTADSVSNGTQLGKNSTRYALIGVGSEATTQNGSNNGSYYDGDIAEIIYFDQPLNSMQLNMMHSHLGIKYGIDLNMADDGSTGAFDERDYHNSLETVLWDFTENSGYANAKAGINRDDNGSLNVTKSTSTSVGSVLTIESGALSNNNALVWGHNGNGLSMSADVPTGVGQRISRVWKADELGETGTLTISFDLAGVAEIPSQASEFILLLDDNGSFTNATQHATGATLNGSIITFTNVDIDDADYFSVGFWTSIVWTGSEWFNGSGAANTPNLSDGSSKLVVAGSGGSLTSDASVASVVVNAASDISIDPATTLTVANGIENNGTINIASSGSLVQTGATANSGSGNYIVQRSSGVITDDTRYQYWSAPISDATMGSAFIGSNTTDFYFFDEGVSNNWSSQTAGANMIPGRGYITTGTIGIIGTAETRLFDGTANNGNIDLSTSNVSTGEFILVGNPYPSAISSVDFVAANAGINGTLWFWNHSTAEVNGFNDGQDYATWTGMGSTGGNTSKAPDDYVQSAQGFFVESSSSNPTISFTNNMRIAGNNTQFFKTSNVEVRNRAWLSISNDSNDFNQLLVGFAPDATDGVDRLYDGKKFKAHPRIAFYSFIDSTELSIQALAKPSINGTKKIPLGVDAWITGNHTIYLDSLDNWGDNLSIVLEDKELESLVNLKDQRSYSFNVDSIGVIHDRFYLNISRTIGSADDGIDFPDSTNISTNVDNVEAEQFKIYGSNQEIFFSGNQEVRSLQIYDLSGKIINELSINNKTARISTELNGIYLVHVTFVNNKVVIHKLKL